MFLNLEFMRSIIQASPQLQRMQEENPELRQVINDRR